MDHDEAPVASLEVKVFCATILQKLQQGTWESDVYEMNVVQVLSGANAVPLFHEATAKSSAHTTG